MRAEDLRKLHDAVPFRPYILVLADGREFPVPHPDFANISPKGTAVSLWDEDGSIGAYLDINLVTEVRTKTRAKRASKKRKS